MAVRADDIALGSLGQHELEAALAHHPRNGIQLGAGIYVNSLAPEDAAAELRDASRAES